MPFIAPSALAILGNVVPCPPERSMRNRHRHQFRSSNCLSLISIIEDSATTDDVLRFAFLVDSTTTLEGILTANVKFGPSVAQRPT